MSDPKIYTDSFLIYPFLICKICEGCVFHASKRFVGVTSDSYVDFLLDNKGSKTVHLIAIELNSTAKAYIDIYKVTSTSSKGTEIKAHCLNFKMHRTPSMKVYYGGSYNLGEVFRETVCPGGSGVFALGSLVVIGEAVVIPPNHQLVVRVTNSSAQDIDFSIRIVWWED